MWQVLYEQTLSCKVLLIMTNKTNLLLLIEKYRFFRLIVLLKFDFQCTV
jgi:hypothetical protein